MNKTDVFKAAADKIKSLGYEVYVTIFGEKQNTDNFTYGFIKSKDGSRVSYIQAEEWEHTVRFSTVYKPNRVCGSGLSLNDEQFLPDELNEEIIENTFKVHYPYRCNNATRNAINLNQYKDFEEWKSNRYGTVIKY